MLSKSTTDQIRKEAERMFGTDGYTSAAQVEGYEQGATTWAIWKERAYLYEQTLRRISISTSQIHSKEIAEQALEQFK